MLKKILIALSFSAFVMANASVYADICKKENLNYHFRQAVIDKRGNDGVRCDYGNEFDFEHSYQIPGKFKPGNGFWQGASDPFTLFCRGVNTDCVFNPNN